MPDDNIYTQIIQRPNDRILRSKRRKPDRRRSMTRQIDGKHLKPAVGEGRAIQLHKFFIGVHAMDDQNLPARRSGGRKVEKRGRWIDRKNAAFAGWSQRAGFRPGEQ